MNIRVQTILRQFVKACGRDIVIGHDGSDWVVSVNKLPGTEHKGHDLSDTVMVCLASFMAHDWPCRMKERA